MPRGATAPAAARGLSQFKQRPATARVLYGLMLPAFGLVTAVLSFLTLAQVRAATDARRILAWDGVLIDF